MTFDFIRASFPEAFSAGSLPNAGREPSVSPPPGLKNFVPRQPETFTEAGIEPRVLLPLVIRYLYQHGKQSGLNVSRQLKLPLNLVEPTLHLLRSEHLIFPKGAAAGNDFVYEILPKGIEKAQMDLELSTYCGAAPVSIEQYTNSVFRQSLRNHRIKLPQMIKALSEFSVSNLLLSQLGQAVNSGKTLMLYGPPGNGKSVLSKQLLKSAHTNIWIPRVLSVGSEIIRVFDPSIHQELPFDQAHTLPPGFEIDHRWVYIQRPTVVAGGELELENLEVTQNPITRILEAPIQVKSNCGCLVIDDFGRQRVGINELLNRWIVPLDRHVDYLTLRHGVKFQIPFELLVVFSTNLDPSDLADEAFLRRIPNKIYVESVSDQVFDQIFNRVVASRRIPCEADSSEYLRELCLREGRSELRACYPMDICKILASISQYENRPIRMTKGDLERATSLYFAKS